MFKLIPRLKPYYTFSDWIAVFNILKKNPIEKYEEEFSKKFENNYGVMFQHGRTGVYALLKVWGLEEDEVICPAYTCVVVPNAIVLSGNVPVFVDSAKDGFNMDLELLEQSITEKTKVIYLIHNFGFPHKKLIEYRQLCDEKGIVLIEDCAFAFDSFDKDIRLGTIGDFTIYSIPKILPLDYGGILRFKNKNLSNKLISTLPMESINSISKWIIKLEDMKLKRQKNYNFLERNINEKSIYGKIKNVNPFMFGIYTENFQDYYNSLQKYELGQTHVKNEFHIPVNQFIESDEYTDLIKKVNND